MASNHTTSLNDSDVTDTLDGNQTISNPYYYYYNGGGEPFNVFDLLPETYRNARKFLYNYLVIIIWIVSLLGNTLVILVLMTKRNRGFSTSIYLKGLAFTDLSLNTSNTFILYLLAHGHIKPPASETECHYRNVFQFAIAFIATWMLVVISLERVISVWLPFKVKRLCTENVAFIVIITVWAFFIGLAFLHESVMVHSQIGCQINQEILEVYDKYLQWILISLKFFIPYVIIFVCTVIIMATLLNRKMRKQSSEKGNKEKSVNIVLLSVNVVFLLTNAPYNLFYLFAEYFDFDPMPLRSYAYYYFWSTYLQVLNDCNSAVNVFVYFLVGSRFRADAKELLFGWLRKKDAGILHSNHKESKTRGTILETAARTETMTSSVPKLYRQDSQFCM